MFEKGKSCIIILLFDHLLINVHLDQQGKMLCKYYTNNIMNIKCTYNYNIYDIDIYTELNIKLIIN